MFLTNENSIILYYCYWVNKLKAPQTMVLHIMFRNLLALLVWSVLGKYCLSGRFHSKISAARSKINRKTLSRQLQPLKTETMSRSERPESCPHPPKVAHRPSSITSNVRPDATRVLQWSRGHVISTRHTVSPSLIRSARASALNPANTTLCAAPMRAQAIMDATASGHGGM